MSKVWNYESKGDDNLSKQVEKDKTIVMTKPEMAKYLISLVNFNEGDKVMEPCKGDGAFYNNLPDNVRRYWCEINEGVDYLTNNDKVDITLSNPPFVPRKLFWDFHLKAMENTSREIYWLINIGSLNVFTPARLEIMKEKEWGIEHIHIVSDKRWFGRYAWVKISKNKSCITWHNKTF